MERGKNDLTLMAGILIPYYKREIRMGADSEYISLEVREDDDSQPISNYPDNIKRTSLIFMFDTHTGSFDGVLTSSGHDKKEEV